MLLDANDSIRLLFGHSFSMSLSYISSVFSIRPTRTYSDNIED